MDYDTDDDYLIEVSSLAQLNAIRWDLNGDGTVDSQSNAAAYLLAFPDRITTSGTPMGSPGACVGYELTANLDFDTAGDGSTHTAGDGDDEDTYNNSDAGWVPLGGYDASTSFTATLEGNGHTISNLFINVSTGDGGFVGLFGEVSNGTVRNLGFINPYVKNTQATSSTARTGALVGRIQHTASVSGVYVSRGTVDATSGTGNRYTGGLVGYVYGGTISDSWAGCAVSGSGSGTDRTGGLVGGFQPSSNPALIRDSYATGAVVSGEIAGGLLAC